ncbi:Uncharacterised protein [BD1-7 clade bacterium]|uniref:Uncharacterized protein n=1 Tax=BD1-7 clade bacterium TaxID=2029982 RepID=A0A5S9QHE9_9GAMM|nr:Uncharacterised protein [BD1-7 clade bacterium]
MSISRSELKVTLAKLLELSYSADSGLTSEIMLEKGGAKLTVDNQGNASLSAEAGVVTFSGKPVLEQVGVKVKRISADFTNEEGMGNGYTVTADLAIISISTAGSFDLEELITSCSGFLCRAAKALQGNHRH